MSEKQITILGHAVDFPLIYYKVNNKCYCEKAEIILLDNMSRISLWELEICKNSELMFVFPNSYDEAKMLYRSLDCETKKKCICLLEENYYDESGGISFADKIMQWIYPKGEKIPVLELILIMLCDALPNMYVGINKLLEASLNAPDFRCEVLFYRGTMAAVVSENKKLLQKSRTRSEGKRCIALSIAGKFTLGDAMDLYDMFHEESYPELAVCYKEVDWCGTISVWHNREEWLDDEEKDA